MTPEEAAVHVLGWALDQAQAYLDARRIRNRLVATGDAVIPVELNYVPGRLDLTVALGRVVHIRVPKIGGDLEYWLGKEGHAAYLRANDP